jgi:DNA-directed RNA polymerase specialized sigma24 family protein
VTSAEPQERASREMVRAAFRELHGPRLHGFSLLLTLGDRPRAARLAADALAEGAERAGELRHPERAAAWLRARVVRAARGWALPATRRAGTEPGEQLVQMGVDSLVFRGLAALRVRERAAIIATEIERLDPLDVAAVIEASPSRTHRMAADARRRYLRAATPAQPPETRGPLAARILEAGRRAIS